MAETQAPSFTRVNNNLEDASQLVFEPTAPLTPLTETGDAVVYTSLLPVLNSSGFSSYAADTQAPEGVQLLGELSWSGDGQTWTPWVAASEEALEDMPSNPAIPVYVRVRYTRTGGTGGPAYLKRFVLAGSRSFELTPYVTRLDTETPVVLAPQDLYKVFSLTGIDLYVKNLTDATSVKADFRYSGDGGRTWTPWTPLTDVNVRATRFNTIRFAKFEFAFLKSGPDDPIVYQVELVGEFQNVTQANKTVARLGIPPCCAPMGGCEEKTDVLAWTPNGPDGEDMCDESARWDPYKYGGAMGFYNYLGNSMARMWGHNVNYFRLDPDANGTDAILHEHALLNVVDKQKVKVVVPGNKFPDGQVKFSAFDLSLLETFEVHITKDAFKKAFGPEYRPGKGDVLEFCDINKVFDIERTIAHRGPFNTQLYYRLILKKHEDKANVSTATAAPGTQQEFADLLKNTTLESLLGPAVGEELDRVSHKLQHTPLSRIVGITVAPSVSVVKKQLLNATVAVSNGYYEVPAGSQVKDVKMVSYGHVDPKMGAGDNRSLTMWFRVTDKHDPAWSYRLFENTEGPFGYSLALEDAQLKFTLNGTGYAISAGFVQPNTWYAALVNLDQRQGRVELAVYSRADEENPHKLKTTALRLLNGGMHQMTPSAFSHASVAYVGGIMQPNAKKKTSYDVTNVRLFQQVLDDDARGIVLNQRIIADAHLLLFADNADAKMQLPEMGNFGD